MNGYTPGPWTDVADGGGSIEDSNGHQVALATLIGLSIRHPEERDANARLIAAAPDLLDTLKRIVIFGYDDNTTLDAAEAAIAKATTKDND